MSKKGRQGFLLHHRGGYNSLLGTNPGSVGKGGSREGGGVVKITS